VQRRDLTEVEDLELRDHGHGLGAPVELDHERPGLRKMSSPKLTVPQVSEQDSGSASSTASRAS
jgi:hypothetical protein